MCSVILDLIFNFMIGGKFKGSEDNQCCKAYRNYLNNEVQCFLCLGRLLFHQIGFNPCCLTINFLFNIRLTIRREEANSPVQTHSDIQVFKVPGKLSQWQWQQWNAEGIIRYLIQPLGEFRTSSTLSQGEESNSSDKNNPLIIYQCGTSVL